MPAGQEAILVFVMVTAIHLLSITHGIETIVAEGFTLLVKRSPTPLVYMICMAMCGSGAVTGMMRVIIPRVLSMIPRGHLPAYFVFFAVAVGTAMPTSAV